MRTPRPRGPLSEQVAAALLEDAGAEPFRHISPVRRRGSVVDDDDFQLSLWMLYELHYRGFDDAQDHEWDPQAIALRGSLEREFEGELRRHTMSYVEPSLATEHDLARQMAELTEALDGPNLSGYLQREATIEQVRDFLAQRSLYHLKESDPQSFVLPRLEGRAKVALAELQYDEYGAGTVERLHAQLFREALDAAGLETRYGAYLDRVPAVTLAVNNVMSLFSLNRRLRGAALGHLAAFESTSAVPCRRIAAGIERVGLPATVAAYFHEHVEADSAHEQVAIRDICGGFLELEPARRSDVLFGFAACLYLDRLAAADLLQTWQPPVAAQKVAS